MSDSENFAASSQSPEARRSIRWRRARRILICLAIVATFIAAFYTEENWRGKQAWAKCRQQFQAQGVEFDWNTRIPPPVADEQNFFKAPKMAGWFVGRGSNDLSLRLTYPKTSSVGSGTNAIQTAADARDYLAWSDQFAPDFEMIRAALLRPYARIECDYGQPMTVLAPNFLSIRNVVQTLAQRTRSFLLLEQPEKALQELTMVHDLCRILEARPAGKPITLLGAMINVAVKGLYADTVADGLRMHAWRDEQLRALEQQLRETHLAAPLAETFIDEPMFSLRTIEITPRPELVKMYQGDTNNSKSPKLLMLRYAPQGWLYQNMVVHAQLIRGFSDGFDATNEIASPRKIDDAGHALERHINHVTPNNFLASWAIPNYVKGLQRYALNQTSINQAAVACALERYHLAHAQYPETLDVLTPQYAEKLPHDLIGGQPLKYRRTDAGTFLLYSVGWNEKDDGGIAGKSTEEGDWVWQNSLKP